MVRDTIDIFESLATIFVPLLKFGARGLKGEFLQATFVGSRLMNLLLVSQKESIKVEIERLEETLLSANNAAKNRHKPHQAGSFVQDQKAVPLSGEYDVVVRHYFHFIESRIPPEPLIPYRRSSGETRIGPRLLLRRLR